MKRFKVTWTEHVQREATIVAENQSAARQCWIDGDFQEIEAVTTVYDESELRARILAHCHQLEDALKRIDRFTNTSVAGEAALLIRDHVATWNAGGTSFDEIEDDDPDVEALEWFSLTGLELPPRDDEGAHDLDKATYFQAVNYAAYIGWLHARTNTTRGREVLGSLLSDVEEVLAFGRPS